MNWRWTSLLMAMLWSGCASTHVVRLDTGQGPPLAYSPPSWSSSIHIDEEAFEASLAKWVLEMPLSIRTYPEGGSVRVSAFGQGAAMDRVWQFALRKEYGRWCRAHEAPGDCLSLLEDGLGFSSWDKLSVAVGLSLDPMHESIAKALEGTFNPTLFKAMVVSALASWVVLAANPEPVFTKAAAVLAAVAVAYLGVDAFLAVVKACWGLKVAADRATTFQELEEAGQRFGTVLGVEGARVFVLAATALLSRGVSGGSAWLAARLPLLPRFTDAAALGAEQAGFALEAVAEVTAVSVSEGQLVMTLAPGAVAMLARGSGSGAVPAPASGGGRGFSSFDAFKRAMGPAGAGRNWHHIVEQTPGNVRRFGPQALHNTDNVIPLDEGIHRRISGLYSSIRAYSRGMTVRQWLSTQSFEAQRDFGLQILRDMGVTP